MLQSSSNTRNMDSSCPQGNKKKDEKDSGRENKSTDFASADTSSEK